MGAVNRYRNIGGISRLSEGLGRFEARGDKNTAESFPKATGDADICYDKDTKKIGLDRRQRMTPGK